MKVYKFGGASVKEAAGVRNLANIALSTEGRLFIVVSAMGKTTNALEMVMEHFWNGQRSDALDSLQAIVDYHTSIVADLWGEPTLPERVEGLFAQLRALVATEEPQGKSYEEWYDHIVSFGELVSTAIVADYLAHSGIDSKWLDIRKIFVTSDRFRDANIDIEASTPRLVEAVESASERVVVAQGFIGATPEGATTTIGREGSDYSAAVAGYILGVESVSIWKDVEGILNGDPKQFEDVTYIPELTYLDAIELAYSGAQIIHPKTIKPLQNKNIPLYVRPFGNKEAAGTRIDGTAEDVKVPIIILKRNQSLLTLRSRDLSFVLEEKFPIVFSILERFRIKTNLIHNSAVDLNLCTESSWRLEEAAAALQAEGFDTTINNDVELLTIRNHTEQALKAHTFSERNIVKQIDARTVRVILRKE